MGRYQEALPEMLEAIRLDPGNSVPYSNLVEIYCRLNRLGEARAAYQQALALNLDRPGLRYNMYGVAFLEADDAEMGRLTAWAAGKQGVEDFLLCLSNRTRKPTRGVSAKRGNCRAEPASLPWLPAKKRRRRSGN